MSQVAKAVSSFTDSNYVKGVSQVIDIASKGLLGRSTGSSETTRKYMITVGATGAIIRIDYLIYIQSIASEKIQ